MQAARIKKIVSISFLYSGERVRIGVDKDGKFQIPRVKTAAQRLRPKLYPHSAKEFVEHEKVRESDPVLTLDDGSKIRVYLGGDPTGMIALAASAIDNHDSAHKTNKYAVKSKRKESKVRKPKTKLNKMSGFVGDYKDSRDYDEYDSYGLFNYPTPNDYDEED
ncbi:MAG TPA: hypothetical protein DCM40_41975 [Maribacter sp.]|nr:hypothetical protein [Maribacter sp.]